LGSEPQEGGIDLSGGRALAELLRRHDIRAATSLGQRFLVDRAVLSAIVDAAALSPDDDVLEVGPGPGVLTAALASRVRSVTAVEVDARMVALLEETLADHENVRIIQADALKVDLLGIAAQPVTRIVANLPYQITTPLLERFRPDVLVTQQGIDTHFTDPLTDLQLSTHAREHVVRWFAATPYPWVAMGGGGYDLDAVRRTWSMEYLIMLGAPVPEALHDEDPPVLGGRARTAVDVATDQATHEALAAAFK